jgi:glycosyltransferase involved in cell wall biosynthesis
MELNKVLMIGRYGHPSDLGGVATATRSITQYSLDEFIDFHLFSIRGHQTITEELLRTASYESDRIKLDIIPSISGFSTKKNEDFESATKSIADTILKKLNNKFYDLIHVFTSYPNYSQIGKNLSEVLGVPYVVSGRGTDVYDHNPEYEYDKDRQWYLEPLSGASRITVLSTFLMQEMKKNLGAVGYNIQVDKIHNGIDPNRFKPLEKESIPEGSLRVAYTGRIRGFKGIIDIIKAIEISHNDNVDIEFNIYGRADRGKMGEKAVDQINTYIKEKNLSKYIHFTGQHIPNVLLGTMYREHNIFMYASRCEGLPNAILEAMACGLAVVSNQPSGAIDLEINPELVFDTGNIEQMSSILTYLAKNTDVLRNAAMKNIEFAKKHHWREIAKKYTEIYKGVIKK